MKTIHANEIPETLSAREFLDSLDLSEDVVLEADGEPRVVLMSPRKFQERHEARERLFVLIDSIRCQNPTADADEVLAELDAP